MATVTMDISELDKLRSDLKQKEERIKDIEKELLEVRADKRILRITKTKVPSKKDFTVSFNENKFHRDWKYNNSFGLSNIVKDNIEIYPIIPLDEEVKEFVNFEDVRKELQDKLEKEYAEEIAELKHIKKTLYEKLREEELNYKDKEKKLIKEHKDIEELLMQEKEEWIKKYKELETGKKELSEIESLNLTISRLTRELTEMNEELQKEQRKKWWHKLFS